MSDRMEFPETFEKFAEEYGFKDDKKVYTNGSDLISVFRVKQWLEHDNKLRTIETDTAYECGKYANKWIPVSERLPEDGCWELFTNGKQISIERYKHDALDHFYPSGRFFNLEDAVAWMPLPPSVWEKEINGREIRC